MKLPKFAPGRIIHGVGEQAGNGGVLDWYRQTVGGGAEPALYAVFESFPGTRGIDATIDHLRKWLDIARDRRVGLSIGFRFQGEDGHPNDGPIALALDPTELRKLALFLATYNDVPMLIRPGMELNGFGYSAQYATPAYEVFVDTCEEYAVQASWCWCIEPHAPLPKWPSIERVDFVGVDIFHAAVLTETGPANDNLKDVVSWARSVGRPLAIPEASPVLSGEGLETWAGWFLPLGQFLFAQDVGALVLLPVDWTKAPGAGGAGWGDARFHMHPALACQWGQWLAARSGKAFVHRTEFGKAMA